MRIQMTDPGCKRGDSPVAGKVQDEILALPLYLGVSRSQMDKVAARKEACK